MAWHNSINSGVAWVEAAKDLDERKGREKSDFLKKQDSEGRWLDLHALRMTLATQLPRVGVTPQVASEILRHSDIRTTLQHYTDLRLPDQADALKRVPSIKRIEPTSDPQPEKSQ